MQGKLLTVVVVWFLLRMNVVPVISEVLEVKMLPIMYKFVCLFIGPRLYSMKINLYVTSSFFHSFRCIINYLPTSIYIIQATIYTWTKIRFILFHIFCNLLSILPKRHHWRFHKSQKEPKGHFWMNYVCMKLSTEHFAPHLSCLAIILATLAPLACSTAHGLAERICVLF